MTRRSDVIHQLMGAPWAILPSALPAVTSRLLAFGTFDDTELVAPEMPADESMIRGAVAVMPFVGIVLQHPGMYFDWPAVFTEWFAAKLKEFLADDRIGAIVINMDSPGGIIYGTPELADLIFAARQVKPIYCISNALSASAGYWIGSSASKMYVTPSGEAGSIGVYVMHTDYSKALEDIGIKVTLVHAGEYKVEGNPYEPLSEEAEAELQRYVDAGYEMFVAAVARNRGVDAAVVLDQFGKGRTLVAARALEAGMVDGIATLDEVIAMAMQDAQGRVSGEEAPPATVTQSRASEDVELRSLSGDVREIAASEGATLEGFVPYGSMSEDMGGWREIFEPGAFADSLASSDVAVLWQHDSKYVFGRTSAGTATVTEEASSVRYTASPPGAQWARDAMESIRRGDVKGNSFAFRVAKGGVRWEKRDGYDLRIISKAHIIEVGPQTFPAYADTSVAVRERAAWQQRNAAMALAERQRALEESIV